MQYFLNALIFCSVSFFNFFLSNFDFVSDDVNIPFVKVKVKVKVKVVFI